MSDITAGTSKLRYCGIIWCNNKRICQEESSNSVYNNNNAMGANTSNCEYINASSGSVNNHLNVNNCHTDDISPSTSNQVMRDPRRRRVVGFATIRKKFIRRRRSSKMYDHGRILKEFVTDWNPIELAALHDEYEALAALKDLSVQAELARPPATTFKQDLATLYDISHCADCELVYRGTIFPVHRALLSVRCSYFRDLLQTYPKYGARICIELRSSPVDVKIFSMLLKYLYTGDLCSHDPMIDINVLRRLGEDFGNPNPLENDLRYLLETGDFADASLVFTSEMQLDQQRTEPNNSDYGFRPKLELLCHKAILSARSTFFRNLILRRMKQTDRVLHVPTRIVLDDTVIPKRYARVLLHAIYLDTVDLSLIMRGNTWGNNNGSLSEVQALTHTGRARPTPIEEAMELYQIGRFLELNILSQGCEDLILEWLTIETLPQVLKWSSQPHGSAWVYRQACHFLREEYSAINNLNVLLQLDKVELINALQSNFLQASELEILQSVLKWGEYELTRRMEDREPNLLNNTAHSVTRKGVKKRDLCDIELRDILSELLPLVRMDHVIPSNHEILNQAIKRGLVSTPPSHMIGDEKDKIRINAWIRTGNSHGLFTQPRLFMPYYDEIKSLVEEYSAGRFTEYSDVVNSRRPMHFNDIPDTLYMVSKLDGPSTTGNASTSKLNLSIPIIDSHVLGTMLKREQKLRQSASCQRALMLPLSSNEQIKQQIRLRVVREFNFPDNVCEVLKYEDKGIIKLDKFENEEEQDRKPLSMVPSLDSLSPNSAKRNFTFPRHQRISQPNKHNAFTYSHDSSLLPVIPSSFGSSNIERLDLHPSSCSELSEVMPDVAMATSSIGLLQLHSSDLNSLNLSADSMQLDLGDGGASALPINPNNADIRSNSTLFYLRRSVPQMPFNISQQSSGSDNSRRFNHYQFPDQGCDKYPF